MEDVMIRWANDDAPVPTSSELFFKILTLSHSSLLTPLANSQLRLRLCAGDRSERAVRRSTESCRGGGGKAQQGSCAARRTLSFSPLCCESHLLAFNSMNESTNRENFMVWLDNGSTGICCGKGRVEVTNQFHRKFREHQNKCKTCLVKQEMILNLFSQKKMKKASRPHPISHSGKRCLLKMFTDNS